MAMALSSNCRSGNVVLCPLSRSFSAQVSSQRRPLLRFSPGSTPLLKLQRSSFSPGARHGRIAVCEASKMADAEMVELDQGGLSNLPSAQGVYAVFDKDGALQYVGMSRRVSTSIQGHARELPRELCSSVKVAPLDAVDREGLREAWESWIREHFDSTGSIPPGNEPGNKGWARKKPVKQDIKLKPSKSTELTIPLEELIDKLVKDMKVVAFIKGTRTNPQCGFSHRVLTILNEQHVEYETVNVLDEDHNAGVREAIKAYSQWPTIPQVFVGGEFIGGADVLSEMSESGELAKLFGKSS